MLQDVYDLSKAYKRAEQENDSERKKDLLEQMKLWMKESIQQQWSRLNSVDVCDIIDVLKRHDLDSEEGKSERKMLLSKNKYTPDNPYPGK